MTEYFNSETLTILSDKLVVISELDSGVIVELTGTQAKDARALRTTHDLVADPITGLPVGVDRREVHTDQELLVSLQEVVKRKRASLQAQGFSYAGISIPASTDDVTRINSLVAAFANGIYPALEVVQWKTRPGEYLQINGQVEALSLAQAAATFTQSLFGQEQAAAQALAGMSRSELMALSTTEIEALM